MELIDFLNKHNVNYEVTEHAPAFTAQQIAALEHEAGIRVAKPVVVKADGKYYMCVLPACYKIDLDVLKTQLKTKTLDLASEKEMATLFPDCALGAEPPFGNLYELSTIMDKTLEADEYILFQAGTHEKAIRITMADYKKLVSPKVLDFSLRLV